MHKWSNRRVISALSLTFLLAVLTTMLLYPIFAANPGDVSTFYLDQGARYEASYVVGVWNSTHYYAMNGTSGEREWLLTDASQIINNALDGLTSDRTWQEEIVLNGNFTINAPILVPNYVTITINGRLTLGNNVNRAIFRNSFWGNASYANHHITIRGGTLDGNEANNPNSVPDHGLIALHLAVDVLIENVHVQDANAWSAIYVVGSGPSRVGGDSNTKIRILNNVVERTVYNSTSYGYGIGVSSTPQEVQIIGNQLFHNQGGILIEDVTGMNDSPVTIAENIINNSTEGHGIWAGGNDLVITENIINNTQAHGISCQAKSTVSKNVISFSGYSGINSGSNFSTYTGNVLYNNTWHGLRIGDNRHNSVIANIAFNNTGNGIFIENCYNTTIIGNIVSYNGGYGLRVSLDFNIIVGNNGWNNGDASYDIYIQGTNNANSTNLGRQN